MQGAQKLRSEAYLHVRCNDEVEAQRRRWTFYETIMFRFLDRPQYIDYSRITRGCSLNTFGGGIAQLGEHSVRNAGVEGSNPFASTNQFYNLA
jgi:hypothetical protein